MVGPLPALVALLVSTALPTFAAADIVHLRSGGQLEGEVEKDGDFVKVALRPGMVVAIPKGDVVRIDAKPSARQAFEQRFAALKPYDAEGFFKLALDSDAAGRKDDVKQAAEAAIGADPDHAGARELLGQVSVDGEWIDRDEAQRRAGKLLYAGRWVTEAEKVALETKVHGRESRKLVRNLLREGRRGSNPETAVAIWERLLDLAPDPAAGSALRSALGTDPYEESRRMAAGVLRAWPGDATAEALIDAALDDDDTAVREVASISLHLLRSKDAAKKIFKVFLNTRNDDQRRRAADTLVILRCKETVEPLIYALYKSETVRREVSVRGRQRGDQDSYFMGLVKRETRRVTDYRFDRLARDVLIGITGVNFDYAKGDWLAWWDETHESFGDFMQVAGEEPEPPEDDTTGDGPTGSTSPDADE